MPQLCRQQDSRAKPSSFPFDLAKFGLAQQLFKNFNKTPASEQCQPVRYEDIHSYSIAIPEDTEHKIQRFPYNPQRLWVRLRKHSDYVWGCLRRTNSNLFPFEFPSFFSTIIYLQPCIWGNRVPEHWLGVNLSILIHTWTHILLEEIANLILCTYQWDETIIKLFSSHFARDLKVQFVKKNVDCWVSFPTRQILILSVSRSGWPATQSVSIWRVGNEIQ